MAIGDQSNLSYRSIEGFAYAPVKFNYSGPQSAIFNIVNLSPISKYFSFSRVEIHKMNVGVSTKIVILVPYDPGAGY